MSRDLTRAETGALIERLGRAVTEHRTTWDAAIAELMAARTADTRLSRQGAIGQLTAWRSAVQRYSFPAATADPAHRAVDAREFRARPPITFRFPPREDVRA